MRVLQQFTQVSITAVSLSVYLYSQFTNQIASAAFPAPLRSKQGMVTSAHPLASDAGLQMLKKGGNAVDAAVATTFAISVVEPFSAGIGGGGFLLIYQGKTGKIEALDFRERAPIKASRNMYLDAQGKVRENLSTNGHLAVATPGTVAGLYEVHRKYGKLPWRQIVQPAITLAQDGFILAPKVTPRSITAQEGRKKVILANPAARKIFTRNGDFYQPGEKLVQRDLAQTLTEISRNPQSFYTGGIAKAISSDMAKNGGIVTLQDLKTYKPIWRNPVCGNFRNNRICSMPPPSSGGVHLLQILNIIGETNLQALGWHHPDALHLLVEAMKIAYADRAKLLGDPDFVKVPVAQLISPEYAKIRRQQIDMERAKPSSQVKPADTGLNLKSNIQNPQSKACTEGTECIKNLTSYESQETSHLNVVDGQRNAISLTFTINTGFGAGVVAEGTGILLNNEMDDFAIAPGIPNSYGLVGNEANANAIAPRKTPLSSMTPTIITENGKLRMVTGTPGGSTIITQVLQVVLNVLEYKMNASAAVSAPRIHHQWLPDELRVEAFGLDTMTLQELRRRGHNIVEKPFWGNANIILVNPDGILEGATDTRGEGEPRAF
ncbi:gamma-glutamyltransferase [Brunnivagina elsteri]|uniref:Glutathione hydrolase proenzyme n=1 Tax=Brunnivagina elsteri CCALA 953 TaxID=987040 RepID=A0A2A2TJC7_9CYAN|nr:gamma-glutamyltransferase [Calothrix elsteri]PAX54893.1 gamma-glutamyltransferase [Calothrix elsteri CCALA 953]